MNSDELQKVLKLLREYNVLEYTADAVSIKLGPAAPVVKPQLSSVLGARFGNQPEVQYMNDLRSDISKEELAELAFAGVVPQQKKQPKIKRS